MIPENDTYQRLVQDMLNDQADTISKQGGPWEDAAMKGLRPYRERLAALVQTHPTCPVCLDGKLFPYTHTCPYCDAVGYCMDPRAVAYALRVATAYAFRDDHEHWDIAGRPSPAVGVQ